MQGQPDDSLLETAFEWFVALRDPDLSGDQRQAFSRWLAADRRHAQAWAEAQALWERLDVAEPVFAHEAVPSAGPAFEPRPEPRHAARAPRRWRGIAVGIAASLIAVVAGTQLWQRVPLWSADHRTEVAERRSVQLPDGSSVELASDSAISVDFTGQHRRIQLLKGEAYFSVAADASRPFVVDAGRGSSRALGTEFDVRRAASAVDVIVTEHAVEVAALGRRQTVEQGYRVRYDGRILSAPTESDVDLELAWRSDRLMFREASLQDVVAALNQHRRGHIFIAERALASRSVTVALDLRDPEAALQALSEALSLQRFQLGGFIWLSA